MAAAKLPRYSQQYIIKGRWLGQALRQYAQVHEEKQAPCSEAFFCPVCGDVWALAPVTDNITNAVSAFIPRSRPCEAHDTNPHSIPGSIWLSWDDDFCNALPDEVIKYEFNQALKLFKEET